MTQGILIQFRLQPRDWDLLTDDAMRRQMNLSPYLSEILEIWACDLRGHPHPPLSSKRLAVDDLAVFKKKGGERLV